MYKRIDALMKDVPLSTRLRVLNQMMLIDFLTVIGVREDKAWSDDEDELLSKLMQHAKEMTAQQIEEISKEM